MKDSKSLVPESTYKAMLFTLQNLGNVSRLHQSAFIGSCLVESQVGANGGLTAPEAIREILTELLDLFDVGAKELAEVLRLRFWEGKTVAEVSEKMHYPDRTLQDRQREAIYLLAGWFVVREEACTKSESKRQPEPEYDRVQAPVAFDTTADWDYESEPEPLEDEQAAIPEPEPVSIADFPKTPFKTDFEERDRIQAQVKPTRNLTKPNNKGEPGLLRFLLLLATPSILITLVIFIVLVILVVIYSQ